MKAQPQKLPNPVTLIISGGQSGADLAGNEFAETMHIQTCCYVFKGFKPVNKEDEPLLEHFQKLWVAMDRPDDYTDCLRARTIYNVKRADATIIFIHRLLQDTAGSKLTWKISDVLRKPFFVADIRYPKDAVNGVVDLIQQERPAVLNIAGERLLERKAIREILGAAWLRI